MSSFSKLVIPFPEAMVQATTLQSIQSTGSYSTMNWRLNGTTVLSEFFLSSRGKNITAHFPFSASYTLTLWGMHYMVTILHSTYSNTFPVMKRFIFLLTISLKLVFTGLIYNYIIFVMENPLEKLSWYSKGPKWMCLGPGIYVDTVPADVC